MIKHLRLVVNAKKVATEFDDKYCNMMVVKEIGTRYSAKMTKECPFNPV